jgi:hypothetical protein
MITQKQQSTRHQSLMDPITPFHPDSNEDTEPPSLPPKKKHSKYSRLCPAKQNVSLKKMSNKFWPNILLTQPKNSVVLSFEYMFRS